MKNRMVLKTMQLRHFSDIEFLSCLRECKGCNQTFMSAVLLVLPHRRWIGKARVVVARILDPRALFQFAPYIRPSR